MLLSLSIRDFVIVDRLDLAFEPGFTVLTGETGAGKSILVDALGLVLGDRAEAGVVRLGAARAEIAAEFDLADCPAAERLLVEAELTGDEGRCLLRRVVDAAGRSRAFVNGHAATLQQLRALGSLLVDIHGQHAHQSLLRPEVQRDLLTGFAGAAETARAVAAHFEAWQAAARVLEAQTAQAEARARERAELEARVAELAQLSPGPEEWSQLTQEHRRLTHAARLIAEGRQALDILLEGEGALVDRLAYVMHLLAELETIDPTLSEVSAALSSAEVQFQEAGYGLRRYLDRLELDPQRLAECEARLSALHAAARRYRVRPEELPALLEDGRARLSALDAGSDFARLRQALEEAQAAYWAKAKALSAARGHAAAELSARVTALTAELALPGARFEVALQPLAAPASFGLERVEFLVATHPKADPAPLARVASGGELSRLSLAIEMVATNVAGVPTLVFDEVDVGIGGGVAEIVGGLLARLGERRQVLCVTHLPQVAAQGQHHFLVRKGDGPEGVRATVCRLEGEARVDELARMLGGVEITPTTRAHAAEMLARQPRVRGGGR